MTSTPPHSSVVSHALKTLRKWDHLGTANTLLYDQAIDNLEEQLEATKEALREIAKVPCALDLEMDEEEYAKLTVCGDGDCPSCHAALALGGSTRIHSVSFPASTPPCPYCGMTSQVEPSRKEPGKWMCHGCADTFPAKERQS